MPPPPIPSLQVPLFGLTHVPSLVDRAPSQAAIPSGIKALDAFCPLKVGHSMVVSGEPGVGKSRMALNILEQMDAGRRTLPVVTVLALVGKRPASIAATLKALAAAGRQGSTVVVASTGELCAALSPPPLPLPPFPPFPLSFVSRLYLAE